MRGIGDYCLESNSNAPFGRRFTGVWRHTEKNWLLGGMKWVFLRAEVVEDFRGLHWQLPWPTGSSGEAEAMICEILENACVVSRFRVNIRGGVAGKVCLVAPLSGLDLIYGVRAQNLLGRYLPQLQSDGSVLKHKQHKPTCTNGLLVVEKTRPGVDAHRVPYSVSLINSLDCIK